MQWDFEPGHSAAEFRRRHMMVTWVRGHFKNIRGFLNFNLGDQSRASVRAEIDAKAIWTGEPQRDAHLRSADFLQMHEADCSSTEELGDRDLGKPHIKQRWQASSAEAVRCDESCADYRRCSSLE